MKAAVVSVQDRLVRVRLDGRLKTKHTYPGRDDANVVEASFAGYVDAGPDEQRIRSLRLVTEQAVYGREAFAPAARSLP